MHKQPTLFTLTPHGPEPALAGRTDPVSSHEAAQAAEHVKGTHFAAILAILRRNRRRPGEPIGHSSAEIAAACDEREAILLPTTESVARRIKEMIERGLIRRIQYDGQDLVRTCTVRPTRVKVTVVEAVIQEPTNERE